MAVEEIDAFWRTTGPYKRIFVIKYSRKEEDYKKIYIWSNISEIETNHKIFGSGREERTTGGPLGPLNR